MPDPKSPKDIFAAWAAKHFGDSPVSRDETTGAILQKALADLKSTISTDVKAVEAWFVKHFHDSAISADTDKFNAVHTAVEDLKAQLAPKAPAAAVDSAADAE